MKRNLTKNQRLKRLSPHVSHYLCELFSTPQKAILNEMDPFLMESIKELKKERLFYRHVKENSYYAYDCEGLSNHLLSSYRFECPFTREKFTQGQIFQLDCQNQRLKIEIPPLLNIYNQSTEFQKKEKDRISHLEYCQEECNDILKCILAVSKFLQTKNCIDLFKNHFLPYLVLLYQKMIRAPAKTSELADFQKSILSKFEKTEFSRLIYSILFHLPSISHALINLQENPTFDSTVFEKLNGLVNLLKKEPVHPVDYTLPILERYGLMNSYIKFYQ